MAPGKFSPSLELKTYQIDKKKGQHQLLRRHSTMWPTAVTTPSRERSWLLLVGLSSQCRVVTKCLACTVARVSGFVRLVGILGSWSSPSVASECAHTVGCVNSRVCRFCRSSGRIKRRSSLASPRPSRGVGIGEQNAGRSWHLFVRVPRSHLDQSPCTS